MSFCLEKATDEPTATVKGCVRWMDIETCLEPDGSSSDCYGPNRGLPAAVNVAAMLYGLATPHDAQSQQICHNYDRNGTLESKSVCGDVALGFGEGFMCMTERVVEPEEGDSNGTGEWNQ